jgi:hypothetical protein
MSGTVCPLSPGFEAQEPRIYDPLSLEYSEYALSARRQAVRVRRSYAQTTVKNARLSSGPWKRSDLCRRGSRQDICDGQYNADRCA